MCSFLRATLVLTATPLLAVPAAALERTEVRADLVPGDEWTAGSSVAISYYNICTGWLWVWSNFDEGETFGVVFDPGPGGGQLVSTQAYFWTGAPSGWGHTGTLSIHGAVGGECRGPMYDSRPLLPVARQPVIDTWTGVPPGPVALVYTYGWNGFDASLPRIPTDHPAAGPTGPQACGLCYPSTRETHTFLFGSAGSPLCPGSPVSDGVCNAEGLFWSAVFEVTPVPVEESLSQVSWATLKNLYR